MAPGGSARDWSVQLDEPVAPVALSSELELHLVLAKTGAPAASVGYEVAISGQRVRSRLRAIGLVVAVAARHYR
jgi:hypothetical protein